MRETPRDLAKLQKLLDASIGRAGEFLRRSFGMPEHTLLAAQFANALQGCLTVAFATTTAKAEPRVAPTNALFYRGGFYVPTVTTSARARHARKRPAVSLTYYSGNDLAVVVHGRTQAIHPEHRGFAELAALQEENCGSSVLDWGEGVYLRVRADVLYTPVSQRPIRTSVGSPGSALSSAALLESHEQVHSTTHRLGSARKP